jgi:nucleotide-binding universal stress UspA family protein
MEEAGVFTRIVVGTDGSDTASQAVSQATELAKLTGATLSIVSAYAPKRGTGREGRDAPADVQYEIGPREDINMVLDSAAAEAKNEGVEVEKHAVEGDPSDAILNTAEKTNADLIVVGNKGMAGARRFLGSIPNNVSHHAPCSVIIVRTT